MPQPDRAKNSQATGLEDLTDDLRQTIEDNQDLIGQENSTAEALLRKKGFVLTQIRAFLNKLGL